MGNGVLIEIRRNSAKFGMTVSQGEAVHQAICLAFPSLMSQSPPLHTVWMEDSEAAESLTSSVSVSPAYVTYDGSCSRGGGGSQCSETVVYTVAPLGRTEDGNVLLKRCTSVGPSKQMLFGVLSAADMVLADHVTCRTALEAIPTSSQAAPHSSSAISN